MSKITDETRAVLATLREKCGEQRADWAKESRDMTNPKHVRASCAMAAGSFGTVIEWIAQIERGGAS